MRTITWFFSNFPFLTDRWARKMAARDGLAAEPAETPWTPLETPISKVRLGLVTTGGLHLRDQKPFDVTDEDGDPSMRVFPTATPDSDLMITHHYYDHRDADRDLELILPRRAVRDFAEAGRLGGIGPRCYSLMGHIAGNHLNTLQTDTAIGIARGLAEDGVDAVLLVPA